MVFIRYVSEFKIYVRTSRHLKFNFSKYEQSIPSGSWKFVFQKEYLWGALFLYNHQLVLAINGIYTFQRSWRLVLQVYSIFNILQFPIIVNHHFEFVFEFVGKPVGDKIPLKPGVVRFARANPDFVRGLGVCRFPCT